MIELGMWEGLMANHKRISGALGDFLVQLRNWIAVMMTMMEEEWGER